MITSPREAVGDRNRPPQVDRVDDVGARPLSVRHGGVGHAERFVDAERLGIAHQHRKQHVGAEVAHVVTRVRAQVQRLTLRADEAGVEQRQRVAANLDPVAGSLEAGDDVGRVHGLCFAGG